MCSLSNQPSGADENEKNKIGNGSHRMCVPCVSRSYDLVKVVVHAVAAVCLTRAVKRRQLIVLIVLVLRRTMMRDHGAPCDLPRNVF